MPPRPRPTRPYDPVEHDGGPWDSRAGAAPSEIGYGSSRPDPLRILLGAVAAAARARAARAERTPYGEPRAMRPRGGGCLGRILMLVLLLLAFVVLAPLFLGALLSF